MNTTHCPDPEFVGNLERELRLTVRRQARFDNGPAARGIVIHKHRWTTALVALVAMGIGSAATFAVTQRLRAPLADLVIARAEAQLEFAGARLELFVEESLETEARAAAGLLTPTEVDAMRLELARVQADATARALDVEEACITGREPDNSLCAPILRGRDFVTERLELQRDVLRERVAMIERQAAGRSAELVESSVMAREQEAARAALAQVEERLALRQDYLSGTYTAREVELAHLQSSVEAERELAARRVNDLQSQLDRLHALFEDGLASRADVRAVEMEFRAATLQNDLADLELQILERKLADPSDQ